MTNEPDKSKPVKVKEVNQQDSFKQGSSPKPNTQAVLPEPIPYKVLAERTDGGGRRTFFVNAGSANDACQQATLGCEEGEIVLNFQPAPKEDA